MSATLEDLERRVADLEKALHSLQRQLGDPVSPESAAARGARMLRQAEAGQEELATGWARFMKQAGIQGEPMGAEKLQELMLAEGVNPESNELSKGLIETREE